MATKSHDGQCPSQRASNFSQSIIPMGGSKKIRYHNDSGLGAGARPCWRRWRDLNSRYGYCRTTAFRVRTLQPLGYISKGQRLLYQKFCYLSRADGGKIIQSDDRRNQRSPCFLFLYLSSRRFECSLTGKHPTHSDRVTDIGSFSL